MSVYCIIASLWIETQLFIHKSEGAAMLQSRKECHS